uniref:1,3-beta-glucanosyltransferase n=1 Tax=Blastobotrys adeninivorans TaxID=409370 RepID=A0A060SZZ4_BLAAD
MKVSTLVIAAAATLANAALAPIEIKGNAFYQKGNDTRFYIRGVDYQPGGSSELADPIADAKGCKRDVEYFKELGVNTIRVYSVDSSADHDECMKALDDAGIYLLLDVNTPHQSLNRADPDPSYNAAYLQNVFAIIDKFKDYDNTFGFFAANEVINSVDGANTTEAAPYVKAVVRDMKAYIKAQAKRKIPVGYSAADVQTSRFQQMQYFNCGDEDERIDMFGMNDYSWCGDSSFEKSGYKANVDQYTGYSIPMFFSEFGCNKGTQNGRPFTEIEALYSDKMSSVYSGGLVYEYSQEDSNYGLVELNGDSVKKLKDFDTLKKQFAKVQDPSGDGGASTSSNSTGSPCPSYDEKTWMVKEDDKVPPMPSEAMDYIKHGAGKGLGTAAPDTQAGATSFPPAGSGTANPDSLPSGSGSSSDSSSSGSSSGSSSSSGAAGAVKVPQVFSSTAIIPSVMLAAAFVFGVNTVF